MSKEFRSVHQANEALAIYKETNNLEVLRSKTPTEIGRFDVWICVFAQAKENEAVEVLQEKELYHLLLDSVL